jgi:hypothetical protein
MQPLTSEELKEYVDRLKVERDAEIEDMRHALAANTQLTAEAKTEITKLRAEVEPMVDALKTMRTGIRTIGHIGMLGTRVGKFLLVCLALWGATKVIAHGASLDDAAAMFWRIMGGR